MEQSLCVLGIGAGPASCLLLLAPLEMGSYGKLKPCTS